MNVTASIILVTAAAIMPAGAALARPAALTDSQLDAIVAGLDGRGNGNGNGNVGDFNGNANSGNGNGSGNLGSYNGNAGTGNLNGNGTVGDFHGNGGSVDSGLAGAAMPLPAPTLTPLPGIEADSGMAGGFPIHTAQLPPLQITPGPGGVPTAQTAPPGVAVAPLPLSLGWVPGLPHR